MSHFSLMVLVPQEVPMERVMSSVENKLAPFDESLEVTPYVKYNKEIAIQEVRDRINKLEQEILTFSARHYEGKSVEESIEWFFNEKHYADEQLKYEMQYVTGVYEMIQPYAFKDLSDEACWQIALDGPVFLKIWALADMNENQEVITTYNPNSKWDWYEVNGRWEDIIKEDVHEDCPFFNKYGFTTLDALKSSPLEYTYAILDLDNQWQEPGEMGWFGMSSATPESQRLFREEAEAYLDTLPAKTWVCFVDCHI